MISKETDQYRDQFKAINDKETHDLHENFEVHGAGKIQVSTSAEWQTGGAHGFSIGISWGRYGYAGGVMSRDEALRLANHIQTILSQPE